MGGPKFRAFLSPTTIFFFSSLSWRSSCGMLVPGPSRIWPRCSGGRPGALPEKAPGPAGKVRNQVSVVIPRVWEHFAPQTAPDCSHRASNIFFFHTSSVKMVVFGPQGPKTKQKKTQPLKCTIFVFLVLFFFLVLAFPRRAGACYSKALLPEDA